MCSSKIKKAVRELRGENITEDSTTIETYRAIKDILKPEQMVRRSLKVDVEGVTVENPQELAELFNEFFLKKIRKLREKIRKQDDIEPLSILKNKVKDLGLHFELREVEEKQVMKILQKLTPKTSCGIDGISSEVLKLGAEVLCVPLTLSSTFQ